MRILIYFIFALPAFSEPLSQEWQKLFIATEKQKQEQPIIEVEATTLALAEMAKKGYEVMGIINDMGSLAGSLARDMHNVLGDPILNETHALANPSKDNIELAIDTGGAIPGLGIFVDAGGVVYYVLDGEWGDVLISVAAMAPGIGQGFAAARIASKAAKEAGDEMVTVYRGVSREHIGYKDATQGLAKPRNPNGHSDPRAHSLGDNDSRLVSTSYDYRTAKDFAFGEFGEGVVIKAEIPKKQLIKSPDPYGEFEALYEGELQGVGVEFVEKIIDPY